MLANIPQAAVSIGAQVKSSHTSETFLIKLTSDGSENVLSSERVISSSALVLKATSIP